VNRHQVELAQRREELVARSVAQRNALIASAAPLAGAAAALDRIAGTLRRYSVVAGVVAGVAALFGSRRLLEIGSRLVTLYLLVRRR
jgi:hypothetical protein